MRPLIGRSWQVDLGQQRLVAGGLARGVEDRQARAGDRVVQPGEEQVAAWRRDGVLAPDQLVAVVDDLAALPAGRRREEVARLAVVLRP